MRPSRLLLVNFHYVRTRDQYAYPGIHPIEKCELAARLDDLRERFHMATPEEVESHSHGEAGLCRDSVFLTFDDGLIDHIEVAREILNPRGVRAAFFACSRPILESKAIVVHKIHWLRATTEPSAFFAEFMALLPDNWRERAASQGDSEKAVATYVYDTPEQARLKYLINFHLPNAVVESVTSEMFRRRQLTDLDFCRGLYMGPQELGELASAGHVVGCHGHSHMPFTRLSEEALGSEIRTNVQCLAVATSRTPRWISYPYGSEWAIPPDPESLGRRYDFKVGLTMRRDWNDGSQSPWALNRINVNELSKMI